MKYWLLFFLFALFSCENNQTSEDETETETETETLKVDHFTSRVRQEVEAKLGIVNKENYDLQIYREHLNGDEMEDAVITVNRLDFARKECVGKSGANKRKYGYMGAYNSFFIYDGKTDKISVPTTLSASALAPLRVTFENIQSKAYKDIVIEYRIRNSAFRNYYLWRQDNLHLVFQWKIFDHIGTPAYEANFISFDKGSYSLANDILIHPGKIIDYPSEITDIYSYSPLIESAGDVSYRFFFNPKNLKYMTEQLPSENKK